MQGKIKLPWSGRAKTGLLANCVAFAVSSEFRAPAIVIDNTDLARIAAAVIDAALNKTTNTLYADLDEAAVAAHQQAATASEGMETRKPFPLSSASSQKGLRSPHTAMERDAVKYSRHTLQIAYKWVRFVEKKTISLPGNGHRGLDQK